MTWLQVFVVVGAMTPFTGLVAVAVYQFASLKQQVSHQGACQKLIIRQLARVTNHVRKLSVDRT